MGKMYVHLLSLYLILERCCLRNAMFQHTFYFWMRNDECFCSCCFCCASFELEGSRPEKLADWMDSWSAGHGEIGFWF